MRRLLVIVAGLVILGSSGCAAKRSAIAPTNPVPTDAPTPVVNDGAEVEENSEVISDSSEPTTPTVQPFVPTLTQLTEPGCCVQPFWTIDGQTVLFIDKPDPEAPAAIYGVPITGGEPQVVYERIALPSPDGRYGAYLNEQGQTVVEPFNSEVQWTIPNGGLRVFFSPQSERLAWAKIPRSGNFDQRPVTVSVADIDGSDPREVVTVYGGGIGGWLDEEHLVVLGRDRAGNQDITLFSIHVVDGTRTDIVTNQRIRTVEVAPTGEWLMYTIMLHPDNPENDGLWVIDHEGKTRYKLAVVGAGHWRDATHLLIVPFEPNAESHRIWEFDVNSGKAYPITDPAATPFRIANGDWSISPTGEHIVFYGADDSVWLMTLPPAGYGQ